MHSTTEDQFMGNKTPKLLETNLHSPKQQMFSGDEFWFFLKTSLKSYSSPY